MTRNIRLIVAYDGTDLSGYQRQANAITVQSCLEEALSKVCNEPISIYGASRTDAGVHAKFQVVTFFTTGTIPTANLTRALIAHLPADIVIRRAEEIPLDWKPRWQIRGKEYVYRIYNDPLADPLRKRYHWHVKKPLNVGEMNRAARYLEGTHNFSTLQGANSTPADPVKTVYRVALTPVDGELRMTVIGDGFLCHIVRNMCGLLVDVGLGRIKADAIPDLLAKQDRRCILITAPSQRFCLEQIFFSDEEREEAIKRL